jgi:hypothetical protein
VHEGLLLPLRLRYLNRSTQSPQKSVALSLSPTLSLASTPASMPGGGAVAGTGRGPFCKSSGSQAQERPSQGGSHRRHRHRRSVVALMDPVNLKTPLLCHCDSVIATFERAAALGLNPSTAEPTGQSLPP